MERGRAFHEAFVAGKGLLPLLAIGSKMSETWNPACTQNIPRVSRSLGQTRPAGHNGEEHSTAITGTTADIPKHQHQAQRQQYHLPQQGGCQ